MFSLGHHLSAQRSLIFLTEGLLVFASVLLAMAVRFSFDLRSVLGYQSLFPKILLLTVVCQVCFYYNDLYGDYLTRFGKEVVIKVLQSLAGASLIIFAIYYLYPSLQLGRGIFLITLAILPLLLACWRFCYDRYLHGAFRPRVLIIGTDAMAKSLGRELVQRPELGYKVVGFIHRDPAKMGERVVNPRVIGDYASLPQVVAAQKIDHIIVALDDRRGQLPFEALLTTKLQGVRVEDGTSFYERVGGKIALEQLRPSWLIFGQGFRKSWLIQLLKRAEDLLLSIVGMVLFSPFFLVLAVLVKLTSPGPVFYRQERVGEGEKVFTLYKFRSMWDGAEKASGPVWAQDQDSRVTPIGRFMRRLRLDEIPQMVNVLKGEMSFIGPRPERPVFVQELKEKIPYYNLRFSAKPGITGWAQVRYHYGGTVEGALEKLQYELYYIKNMSLFLDFIVLLETFKVVFWQKGAR